MDCEECPKGACDRLDDGKCKIYNDGYHCLLGPVGTPCDYGSKCFEYNGFQYYTWIGTSAKHHEDKRYYPGYISDYFRFTFSFNYP